ncbi:MAG: small, acid-soluble spore protein, alpha/beta type [Moorella sp. (in: Bacteria)]|nr:small, acid-soluble spore protein, alpha/beta type [Moorella sp. (in: firmicutes)]
MVKKKEDPDILALKLEVAAELGLLPKIERHGWGSLSSAESGKIGGLLGRRLHKDFAPGHRGRADDRPGYH